MRRAEMAARRSATARAVASSSSAIGPAAAHGEGRRRTGHPGADPALEVAADPLGDLVRAPVALEALEVEAEPSRPLPEVRIVDSAAVGEQRVPDRPEAPSSDCSATRPRPPRAAPARGVACWRPGSGGRRAAAAASRSADPGGRAVRAGEVEVEDRLGPVAADVVVGPIGGDRGAGQIAGRPSIRPQVRPRRARRRSGSRRGSRAASAPRGPSRRCPRRRSGPASGSRGRAPRCRRRRPRQTSPLGWKSASSGIVEAELLAEGAVADSAVDADPDQRRAPRLDLAEDLLVDRELVGADRAEVERVEGEHQLAAGEVGERDRVAVLVGEGEVGRRGCRARSQRSGVGLAAEAEIGDQRAVALEVGALEVAEQAAAAADQHQQAAARVVVLAVLAQVLGELVDPLGEQRDLDLGRAGVGVGPAVLADQLLLLVLGQRHQLVKHRGLASGALRAREASTELAGLLDVAVHLRDQVLDPGEALLAPQPLDEGDPQGLPVEVLVEVDEVGLDQQPAPGLEGRADADVDRRGMAVGESGVDAVARVDVARRRGPRWRSGSRASGRACRRRRPRPRT